MGIQRKLKVGEYFQFPNMQAQLADAGVVTKSCSRLTIGDSTRGASIVAKGAASLGGMRVAAEAEATPSKKRSIARGENAAKAHRNFIWMPWVQGAVNYAEQQGLDVMSGPFTGCYMIRYKEPGATTAWPTSTHRPRSRPGTPSRHRLSSRSVPGIQAVPGASHWRRQFGRRPRNHHG